MAVFQIVKKSSVSQARCGLIITPHGKVKTPLFLPLATKGVVKSLSSLEIKQLGFEMILANTYHLMIKPGLRVIKKIKGLHNFLKWPYPILTDSGGFQVFSLGKFRKITKSKVIFQDPQSGKAFSLTPLKALQIQLTLDSDIIMVLDICPSYPCTYQKAREYLELTYRWAKISKKYFEQKFKRRKKRPLLFGIIQGSIYRDLRKKAVQDLIKLDFDGYAIGGLAVGEPEDKMFRVLKWVLPYLPKNKPRYLMGLGQPDQIKKAISLGIDMFDSVIPTRNARHGLLYCFKKQDKNLLSKKIFYDKVKIRAKKYSLCLDPPDKSCSCFTCLNYSLAYLRHLFLINDPLYLRLASQHNLYFFHRFFNLIQKGIKKNRF
jgi:queuine tRNA-ribosyltransferase